MESNDKEKLASFQKSITRMVATNDSAYNKYNIGRVSRLKNYTEEEIKSIIESGSLEAQQRLSRNYFDREGYYRQIITYYATLLNYSGLLIPNPYQGKKLNSPNVQKRYYSAMDYIDHMNLPIFFTNCAQRALVDGAYYGIVIKADREGFVVLDLPSGYAYSRFKDLEGNDLVELNLGYFLTITDEEARKAAFASYPSFVEKAFYAWQAGKRNKWLMLPAGIGICFPFFNGRPLFLDVILATIKNSNILDTEQERALEEIRKIIVQKIPHLQDGRLVFEPDEAEEMHIGSVGMLKSNPNVSVLTTYADVDAIVSKTTSDGGTNLIEQSQQNIYSTAGVSGQLFASTGSSTLESSVKVDISLMMTLANKFARFVTNIINSIFANGNIDFKYKILPVGELNREKYVDSMFKLASSGYSLLVPAVASGLSQRELMNIKDLENNVLKLDETLIPLQSTFTQPSGSTTGKVGRPQKAQEEKSERTIQNETSKDRQTEGGTSN